MITMEEASERAERSLQEYRVQYNRLRREMITVDLLGTLFASRAVEETGGAPARPA
jgi:F0F1-type ATP synthase gamma subunit